MEFVQIKNQNHLFKSIRMLEREKQDFAILFSSPFDSRSNLIEQKLLKANREKELAEKKGMTSPDKVPVVLLIDSFETPELFKAHDPLWCTSVPVCYFYHKDNRIKEYKVFREVLPSRILSGFDIFE
jgi:hypothetical protein